MSVKIPKHNKANKVKSSTEKKIGNTSSIMAFLSKDIAFRGAKLSDKKKERFYADFQILLSSGIDIKSAIELIEDEQKKEKDRQVLTNIKTAVIGGKSLSEAMRETGLFSNYELFSIKIGEESGLLNKVLEELVTFYNKKIKQKRQLINAFSYPILVLFTAFLAVLFMMNTIVPMFKDIFKRFNAELPSITQFIMNLSDFMEKYSIGFILIILFFIILLRINRKKEWYKKYSSWLLLHTPIISPIIKMVYLSRFSQSMALLIGSKTPMLQAINLVKNMMDFYPYEKALEVISEDIMRGATLNESMKSYSVFDSRTISLVKVAEEVNQLDTIFEKLNKQFSDELEHRIAVLSNLLEPILIIFVGVIVGVILVSMYLPIFQLSTSVYGK